MASDMDLPPQESNGNTQPYDDNRNVRTLEPQKPMLYGKSLQPSCEDCLLDDDEEMHTLQRNLNLRNLNSPCLPTNSNPSSLPSEANRQHSMVAQEAAGIKKKLLVSQVQVVEDMDISDDSETFCAIRPKMTKQGIVQPQQEFRTFNCQTSSVNTNEIQSQLDGNNYFRKFIPGHVPPGTQQSLLHLLHVCSTYPTGLAIGCHKILTTTNNRPTEHGEYEEVVQSGKGYQFVKDVGTGSFGCVKLYRDNTTHVLFVKKQILNKDADFLDEVKFLSELNHGNIVQLYGFILRDNTPEILMEYAGVSLEEYTTSCQDDVSEDKIIEITYQGLSGLEYLDSKGIIHYDIKPQNLCVLEEGSNITLKITDFGSAKRETEPPNFMGFTMGYLSPELGIQLMLSEYQSSIQNLLSFDTANYVMMTKSDIFSFALSIMFVYRKEHVFISLFSNEKMSYNGLDEASTIRLRWTILVSLAHNPSLVRTVLIPDVCSSCCHGMRNILTAMVEEVPHKRPTAYEIKYYMDGLLNRIPSNSSLTADIQDQSSLPYGYTGHEKMDTSD